MLARSVSYTINTTRGLQSRARRTVQLSRRLYAKNSDYKFPWPYAAEHCDPVDSGDPRLENPEYRKSLEKATARHRSKEQDEVATRMKEQQNSLEVTDALLSLAQDFESKLQADMEAEKARPLDREVTPEVRQVARDFAVAWNELSRLESAVAEFSGTNYSLEALKHYATQPGKYDFSVSNPKNFVVAEAETRIRMMEDSLCHWYTNRVAEVHVPGKQFSMVLDNIATSTQISGDWMTAYAVELGNPGSKAKEIYDRVASVDPELYKAREHLAEISILEERDQTHRALTAHMTRDRRALWYKEHQQSEQESIAKLEASLHPDSIQLFKSRSERQDIRESVRPVWERAPFPINGKQMTDEPIETALFTLLGDMLRRRKSEAELTMLQDSVHSFEDLIRFHALHAEGSRKYMTKSEAESFLAARDILREAVHKKFKSVEDLGMRLELFRKHPYILRCLSAAVGNWLLCIDFAFWRALPYNASDVGRIELHMGECILNSRMAMRKAYSLLSLPQFGGAELSYIPEDKPSETPYGVNPTEFAFKSPPSAYVDPNTGKFKYQGPQLEIDPYPTHKFLNDSAKLQSLLAEESRRKTFLFWIAILLAALVVLAWIRRHTRLAVVWNDGDSRWSRLAIQKGVALLGTLDSVLYWISYPFQSDGLAVIRTLGSSLFAVYDQTDSQYRRDREDAVSILLRKRDLERRIFKTDALRSLTHVERRRLSAVGGGRVHYSSKTRIRGLFDRISQESSSMLDSWVRAAMHSALVALAAIRYPAGEFRKLYVESLLQARAAFFRTKTRVEKLQSSF